MLYFLYSFNNTVKFSEESFTFSDKLKIISLNFPKLIGINKVISFESSIIIEFLELFLLSNMKFEITSNISSKFSNNKKILFFLNI